MILAAEEEMILAALAESAERAEEVIATRVVERPIDRGPWLVRESATLFRRVKAANGSNNLPAQDDDGRPEDRTKPSTSVLAFPLRLPGSWSRESPDSPWSNDVRTTEPSSWRAFVTSLTRGVWFCAADDDAAEVPPPSSPGAAADEEAADPSCCCCTTEPHDAIISPCAFCLFLSQRGGYAWRKARGFVLARGRPWQRGARCVTHMHVPSAWRKRQDGRSLTTVTMGCDSAETARCGHGGICFACSKRLLATPRAKCPLCRGPISSVSMALHASCSCHDFSAPYRADARFTRERCCPAMSHSTWPRAKFGSMTTTTTT